MDRTFLKPDDSRAKDKIDVAGDEAILKIVPPCVGKHSVLPAQKAALAKRCTVAGNVNRQRLRLVVRSDPAEGVFEGDVFSGKILRENKRAGAFECACGFAVFIERARVPALGENRGRRILADKRHVRLAARNRNALLVRAGLDANNRGSRAVRWNRINSRLHRNEVARFVRRDDEGPRLLRTRAGKYEGADDAENEMATHDGQFYSEIGARKFAAPKFRELHERYLA